MAIFAVRKQNTGKRFPGNILKTSVVVFSAVAGLFCTVPPAYAFDTQGGSGLAAPGGVTPFVVPTTIPTYTYIFNEYLLVSVGLTGTWNVTTPNTDTAGRISFGTLGGNRRITQDDNQPLVGGLSNTGAATFGILRESQWPYGFGDGLTTTIVQGGQNYQNYPAYLRALVDGTTQVNVGFDTASYLLSPVFRQTDGAPGTSADRPLMIARYNIGAGGLLVLEQRIRLVRSIARMEWTIINNDQTAHTVGLRWTMNLRAANSYYFVNSERGVSPRPVVLGTDPSTPGAIVPPIPDTLDVFSRRADTASDPGFHNRQIFRGLDATTPLTVYLANARELAPGGTAPSGQYLPLAQGVRVPTFDTGLATAAYYGNTSQGYSIPAGGRQVVVAYVGAGGSSDLVADDLLLSTESPTSLPYYAGAATLPGVAGNTSATLASVASQFIGTPVTNASNVVTGVNNQFRIVASVYSQKQRLADADVPLSGVSASLTLPPGLRFSIDPATGVRDVSTKLVVPQGTAAGAPGTLVGDQDGVVSWLVEPTGEVYGPVTYQVAVGVASPNPLSRTVGRTLNIPATPLVELPTQVFQQIGFPFQFDPALSNNANPDTVINSLSRPIDEVVLWRYLPDPQNDSGLGRYVIADKIEPGVGYFYRPAQGAGGKRLLYLKGAEPMAQQAPTGNAGSVPKQLILERGWNMISNPYLYDIPLNYLRIVPLENNPALSSLSFAEAVRNGVVRGGIFYFSPSEGGYRFFEDLTSPMKPWQGYWVYVNNRVSVLFATPTLRDAVILPDTGSSDPEPPTRAKAMTAEDWTLNLVARRSDGKQDSATRVGVAPSAASRSLPKPPPFRDYVHMTIEQGTSRYAQVLKSPGAKASWDLALESDVEGKVSLMWPGLNSVPKRVRLSITDKQTGQTTNLRNASSISVNVVKDRPSRFVITAQAEVTRPLAVTLQRAPGTRAQGAYSFLLGLNQDATVSAVVRTTTNNIVGVIPAGRSRNGENRLVWNGRSQNGASVPAGGYVMEVRVTNDAGDSTLRTLPFTVVR